MCVRVCVRKESVDLCLPTKKQATQTRIMYIVLISTQPSIAGSFFVLGTVILRLIVNSVAAEELMWLQNKRPYNKIYIYMFIDNLM